MCPVIRLSETIVRTARSDRGTYKATYILIYIRMFDSLTGGRTFFIANTSTMLKTAQLYEFQAETPQEKEMYVYLT